MAILQKTAQLPTFNQFDVGTGSLNIVRSMVEVIKAAYEQQHTTSKTQMNFGALPYRDDERTGVYVDNTALLVLGWQPLFELHAGIKKMMGLD